MTMSDLTLFVLITLVGERNKMDAGFVFGIALAVAFTAMAIGLIWQGWLLDQYAKRVKELLPPF